MKKFGQGDDPHPGTLHITGSKIGAINLNHNDSGSSGQSNNEEPRGEGWVKLTESLYLNKNQPLKPDRVYKGRHFMIGKWHDAAVKVLPFNDKNWKECDLILKLEQHPYIVKIFDAGKFESDFPKIFIATELCQQSLKQYIEENRQNEVDFDVAFSLTKKIFEAVTFIHQNGIVHMDIQLNNVLVFQAGDLMFPKIADFGLSMEIMEKRSTSAESDQGHSADGYAAPELITGKEKASFKSDVFALGILTYQLFTNGKHPYGPQPFRWQANIVDKKEPDFASIPWFKKTRSHKRKQLITLLTSCLQSKATDRPMVKDLLGYEFFAGRFDM